MSIRIIFNKIFTNINAFFNEFFIYIIILIFVPYFEFDKRAVFGPGYSVYLIMT